MICCVCVVVFGYVGVPSFFPRLQKPLKNHNNFFVVLSMTENMPGVKVAMFSLGDIPKVFFAVVKSGVVYVVDDHKRRCFHNESVHADCVGFSFDDFPCRCVNT